MDGFGGGGNLGLLCVARFLQHVELCRSLIPLLCNETQSLFQHGEFTQMRRVRRLKLGTCPTSLGK